MMWRKLNRNLRGVALFLVIISLALMATVVADLSYNETVRYKLAIYERDAVKAEALAMGALDLSRLFLAMQSKLQPFVSGFAQSGMPLKAYTIWELLPLESHFLTDLSKGDILKSLGLDVSEALKKREEAAAQREAGAFEPPEGGFGAFDGGFALSISDEESKISLRNWLDTNDQQKVIKTKNLLAALFLPQQYDDLFSSDTGVDRATLIANMFDWMDKRGGTTDPYAPDQDWGRNKSPLDQRYGTGDNLVSRRAFPDSFKELVLVKGMTQKHLATFGNSITLYGEGGKINLLSAKRPVLEALVRYCALEPSNPSLQEPDFMKETLQKWSDYQSEGSGPVTPTAFAAFLNRQGITTDANRCKDVLGTDSNNFTVKSSATVGDVTRTLTLTARFVNQVEELYYFSNN